jgi:CO/xanthine dehydrogenase FAD-binding subunit
LNLPVAKVLRPTSLEEALAALAADPAVRPLAGGTDLVVQLRDGRRSARALLDLSRVDLAGIREVPDGLEIGAGTPMAAIADHPAVARSCPSLAAAAALVGAWPIQCRATLGGNLANASPAADTAPPLLVAGAVLRLESFSGRREVALRDFFRGPGQTGLAPDELIVSVLVPRSRPVAEGRLVERFVKVGPRREQIISMVSLAGRAWLVEGVLRDVRIALGSVAPTPVRAEGVENLLEDRRPNGATRREAALALQEEIAPIDDVRAPARYRRLAAAVLLDRFLEEVSRA